MNEINEMTRDEKLPGLFLATLADVVSEKYPKQSKMVTQPHI